MRNFLAICFATAICTPSDASEVIFSGLDLLDACQSPPNSADQMVCGSYIRGLADGLYMADRSEPALFCSFKTEQDILIVKKFLADHPELLGQGAVVLATEALALACRDSK